MASLPATNTPPQQESVIVDDATRRLQQFILMQRGAQIQRIDPEEARLAAEQQARDDAVTGLMSYGIILLACILIGALLASIDASLGIVAYVLAAGFAIRCALCFGNGRFGRGTIHAMLAYGVIHMSLQFL